MSFLKFEVLTYIEKNGKKEDELLSAVEIHYGGYSHRVFACYVNGKLKYVTGNPRIYLKNDSSIKVMDEDAILVENTDTNAAVVMCENAMLYTYQYPLDISKIPNDENRGWNENYFILTFKGSKLEKAISGPRGTKIMQEMNEVMSKYDVALILADKYGLNKQLIKPILFSKNTSIFKARRAAGCALDNTKLKSLLNIDEIHLEL